MAAFVSHRQARDVTLLRLDDTNASTAKLWSLSPVKSIDAKDAAVSRRPSFLAMAFIALLANLLSTELHECLHLIVGRLCGLPAHFLGLTSAGVDPSIAATARPLSLALMNGVAPLATMLLGVVALFATPGLPLSRGVPSSPFPTLACN
jgi:hypothetical protein